LPDFKRVSGYVIWEKDFPRTASMKIKRQALAEEMAKTLERGAVVGL
jgi:acyl-coenzyme A synthetase/AMP-(fatty) acid ligase